VFYVAMTRARRKLILSYPLTMGREMLSFNQASLFIEELPPHLLEHVELRRMGTSVFRDRLPAAKTDEWSWDASSDADEPTIQIGNDGERY
jgi:ATP-dependent exoDNAse (exonuclease V) beta subunit